MPKVNVLIAFYSRYGSTEALAKAIAHGAENEGADVRLRRAREIVDASVMARAKGWTESAAAMNARYEAPTEDDAEWADALVFGSPTRFGAVCSELKAYIDSLGGLWDEGKLNGKAGAVFASSATIHGGAESTILSLYTPLAHLGLIIVPLGYSDEVLYRAGSPYGANSISGKDSISGSSSLPTELDLEVGRIQGRRVALVAKALKAFGVTSTK